MNTQTNPTIKKVLQRTIDSLIKTKKYQGIKKIEIFFCFGSPYKTAMCQYVYGMKIKTDLPTPKRNSLIVDLQFDTKKFLEKTINVNVCSTDIIFEL